MTVSRIPLTDGSTSRQGTIQSICLLVALVLNYLGLTSEASLFVTFISRL